MIQNQLDQKIATDIRNREELNRSLEKVSAECIECNLCVKQCAFLKKYKTPKKIAENWQKHEKGGGENPFECSLCSLCTAVCPVEIDPKQMFLAMRRYLVASDRADLTRQAPLIRYEKLGTSKRFSFYGLPPGCDTVFFPGCALAGTRRKRVIQLYEHLLPYFQNLGIVLDCCTKPSHDLGRTGFFETMFSEMVQYLVEHNVKTILTACPSCYSVFSQYGGRLTTRSVFEILAREFRPTESQTDRHSLTVQDSCVARFEKNTQSSVRRLIRSCGVSVEEMKHHGPKTLCCGEGGGAHFITPELAGSWAKIRKEEANGRTVVTYCAGCANFLGKISPTIHLLDLLFDPSAALAGKSQAAKSPYTYWHRLLLKRKFRKKMNYAFSRERTFIYQK